MFTASARRDTSYPGLHQGVKRDFMKNVNYLCLICVSGFSFWPWEWPLWPAFSLPSTHIQFEVFSCGNPNSADQPSFQFSSNRNLSQMLTVVAILFA